eukprot:4162442-Pyramimonas_sp.AAC.2
MSVTVVNFMLTEGRRRAFTVHAAVISPSHNDHSYEHRVFCDSTIVMAEYFRGFAHKRPIRGCSVEIAAREAGWDSARVLDMVDQRIEGLSRYALRTLHSPAPRHAILHVGAYRPKRRIVYSLGVPLHAHAHMRAYPLH